MLQRLIGRRASMPHADALGQALTQTSSIIQIKYQGIHTYKYPGAPNVSTPLPRHHQPSQHIISEPRPWFEPRSNDSIIDDLLKSNEAWAASVIEKDPDFFKNSAKRQSPKVLWLGCSDSRIPESVILAAKPGDIFVHRNIGNQFRLDDISTQAVLDFSIGLIKAEHVLVVGHTHCGACEASLSDNPPTDKSILSILSELLDLAGSLNVTGKSKADAIQALVEANVKHQVRNVIASSAVQNAWRKGRPVTVHGWVYDLETGRLNNLDISVGPVGPVHPLAC